MLRKTTFAVICLVFLLALAGCSCEKTAHEISDIEVNGSGFAKVNAPEQLEVDPKFRGDDGYYSEELGDPKNYEWTVEPPDGAKISADGVFTATKPGHYEVTATGYNKQSFPKSIDVGEADVQPQGLQRRKGGATKTTIDKSKPEVQLFFNGNGGVVLNGGKNPEFKLDKATLITQIRDYHWNSGDGASPPGKISLKDSSGKTYGPWSTTGLDGQGGGKNCYWNATPNIQVKAGTYTIVDSDPSTYSQNEGSSGFGMSWVFGKQ